MARRKRVFSLRVLAVRSAALRVQITYAVKYSFGAKTIFCELRLLTMSPAGSTTDEELAGNPSSINSDAQTNSCMALQAGSGDRETVSIVGSSKLMFQ